MTEKKNDIIYSPSHYTNGKIEAIDYIRDSLSSEAYEGYLEGCIKKYLHRWRYKGKPDEDLMKAEWYLSRLIEYRKEKET